MTTNNLKKNVLIIGGSGFIGKNLIDKYIEQGYYVLNYDKVPYETYTQNSIENFNASSESQDFEKIFSSYEIDHIVYLINTVHPSYKMDMEIEKKIEENIVFPIRIIDFANKKGINKIIYFSSGGAVYGNYKNKFSEHDKLEPITFYGITKKIVENYLIENKKNNDLDFLILRPSNPYGKYQNILNNQGIIAIIINKILKSEPVEIWGSPEILRDYINIEDLTKIYFEILQRDYKNEIFNIASGKVSSVSEIISTFEKILNKKIETRLIPMENLIKVNSLDTSKIELFYSSDKFKSLEEGIRNMLKEYKLLDIKETNE